MSRGLSDGPAVEQTDTIADAASSRLIRTLSVNILLLRSEVRAAGLRERDTLRAEPPRRLRPDRAVGAGRIGS